MKPSRDMSHPWDKTAAFSASPPEAIGRKEPKALTIALGTHPRVWPDAERHDYLIVQIGAAAAAGDRQQLLALARELVGTSRTQDGEDEDVLTLVEVAQELRISTRTLWRVLGSDKSFPKPFRVRRSLRWRRADIEKFKAQPNTPR